MQENTTKPLNTDLPIMTDFERLPSETHLRLAQVLRVVPVSRSTIWRLVEKDQFPKPIKLTERCTAWKVADIREWLASKSAAS